jgi:hypothetical protein
MDISGAGRARKARRRALLSASVVAAILAATGCAATAAPGHARVATGHVRAATDHVRAAADPARTAAARLRTRSAVSWMAVPAHAAIPWGQVGPGWALAQYSDTPRVIGHQPKPGPTTLYLVDPGARTYRLFTWPGKSVVSDWTLEAWSGDTKRALFVTDSYPGPEKVYQLQLRTGQVTGFTMPSNVVAPGQPASPSWPSWALSTRSATTASCAMACRPGCRKYWQPDPMLARSQNRPAARWRWRARSRVCSCSATPAESSASCQSRIFGVRCLALVDRHRGARWLSGRTDPGPGERCGADASDGAVRIQRLAIVQRTVPRR